MGAYSPAPVLTDALAEQVMAEIVRPTVAALARRGIAYRGVLFAGLMLTAEGPKLIEYNARFGDPECQVLMLRLKDDLLTILNAAVDGVLDRVSVRWRDEAALAVVMAANGYPGTYRDGFGNPRHRRSGERARGGDFPRRDAPRRRPHPGRRGPGAECRRHRGERDGGAEARL